MGVILTDFINFISKTNLKLVVKQKKKGGNQVIAQSINLMIIYINLYRYSYLPTHVIHFWWHIKANSKFTLFYYKFLKQQTKNE